MALKQGDLAILGKIGRDIGRASKNREITIYGVTWQECSPVNRWLRWAKNYDFTLFTGVTMATPDAESKF